MSRAPLPSPPIGGSVSNPDSPPSVPNSLPSNVRTSAKIPSSLKSHAKPHDILAPPVEPKLLRVRKEDVAALCEVIRAFSEQL